MTRHISPAARLRPALWVLTGTRLVTNGAFRYLYPFLPVVARGLDISPARAGLLVSAAGLGGIAAPVVRSAVTGGRERPRRLAIGGVLLVVTGLAVAAGARGLLWAFVGFGILGLGKPVYDAGSVAYVAERTAYGARARYTSLMELTWAGGLLVVAPAAGWVISRSSWRLPLVGLAVLSLAGAAAIGLLLEADRGPEPATGGRGAFGPTAVLVLAATALFFFSQELTFVVFGVWLEADFGASVTTLGGLAAAVGLAELIGSATVLAVADRVGKLRTAVAGLLVSAAAFGALPVAAAIAPAVVLMAAALMGVEIAIVSTIPVASEIWPRSRSRFVAIFFAVANAARAGGAAAGSALFAAGGIGATVIGSVVGQLAAALTLFVLIRRAGSDTARAVGEIGR